MLLIHRASERSLILFHIMTWPSDAGGIIQGVMSTKQMMYGVKCGPSECFAERRIVCMTLVIGYGWISCRPENFVRGK